MAYCEYFCSFKLLGLCCSLCVLTFLCLVFSLILRITHDHLTLPGGVGVKQLSTQQSKTDFFLKSNVWTQVFRTNLIYWVNCSYSCLHISCCWEVQKSCYICYYIVALFISYNMNSMSIRVIWSVAEFS